MSGGQPFPPNVDKHFAHFRGMHLLKIILQYLARCMR